MHKRDCSVSIRTCGHPTLSSIYRIWAAKTLFENTFALRHSYKLKSVYKNVQSSIVVVTVGTSRIILLLLLLRCDAAYAERSHPRPSEVHVWALFVALQLTLVKIIRSVSCGTCMLYGISTHLIRHTIIITIIFTLIFGRLLHVVPSASVRFFYIATYTVYLSPAML